MSKKVYVYSTNPHSYQVHDSNGNAVAVLAGGAGVADQKSIYTPQGVVTTLTAEQYAIVQRDAIFQMGLTNGFFLVQDSKEDADDVAKSEMNKKHSAKQEKLKKDED